jgi:3-phenylpropionate/trans-cinnamate dioxygenase ferredoxin subunit
LEQGNKSRPYKKSKVLDWIKIFNSSSEARERIKSNQPQLIVIGSIRICLTRLANEETGDSFYAVGDKCSHNGESLSKGKVNFLGEIVCPWHGYRFSLQSGRCAENSPDIPTYPVKENEEGFFIGI